MPEVRGPSSTGTPGRGPASRIQSFTLHGYSGRPTVGTATILLFSRAERTRRALVALGKWWGLALGCAFIPVAHLILVPSLLLYGIWQCAHRLGTGEALASARGTCPDCGEEQPLDLAARWMAPQAVSCRGCNRGLTVTAE